MFAYSYESKYGNTWMASADVITISL